MPDIITSLIGLAKNGDVAAAKVLLDRVCPPLKAQAMPISLSVNGSLTEQGNEIINATLAGQIPPNIGSQLIMALSHQASSLKLTNSRSGLKRWSRAMSLKTRLIKLETHQPANTEQYWSDVNLEATKQWLNNIIQQMNDNKGRPEKESHEL
jgi:hypothetical protein